MLGHLFFLFMGGAANDGCFFVFWTVAFWGMDGCFFVFGTLLFCF